MSERGDAAVLVPAERLGAPLQGSRVGGGLDSGRASTRRRALIAELGKFALVGGCCLLLDVAIANLLHLRLGLGPTVSKTASTVLATCASYLGNRAWAFAHRVDEQAGHSRDLAVFMAINLVGLAITLVPVDVGHYLLHRTGALAFNVASLFGTAAATAFRFWAYRRFVFTR